MAVTLKQIAEAAGVSRGTVDRVINGRGHVRPELEKTIRRIAEELDYRPNPFGRALVKSTQTTKIGLICQFSETPFLKNVIEAIGEVREDLSVRGTELLLETIESYDTSRMLAAIDRMLDEGVQGLALTPGNAPEIILRLKEVTESGIPVITFNTDTEGTGRLSYVGLDNLRAGRICAGLMASSLRDGGLILPITGYRENFAHTQRLSAFEDLIREEFPALTLLPTELCFDTDDIAEEMVLRVLDAHPELAGIYIAGTGQAGVCRALIRRGLEKKICLIVYDLTEENILGLKSGAIDFLIDQNAHEQGYRPAMLLFDLLVLNQQPEQEFFYTDPRIINRFFF